MSGRTSYKELEPHQYQHTYIGPCTFSSDQNPSQALVQDTAQEQRPRHGHETSKHAAKGFGPLAKPKAKCKDKGKAIDKGADGLVAVAAGAGGHAGQQSPFALISEIREWFDGPLALSGAIATGKALLAARALGADFGYAGSPFIATQEANAQEDYKNMIVKSGAEDIVYSSLFTGVWGNYLRGSIEQAGMDPDNLPQADASSMNFSTGASKPKAWKTIWGSGQGIGAVKSRGPTAALVDRIAEEYAAAGAQMVQEFKG